MTLGQIAFLGSGETSLAGGRIFEALAKKLNAPLRIALYDDAGSTGKGVPKMQEHLAKVPELKFILVKGADIRASALKDCDVVIFTGGVGQEIMRTAGLLGSAATDPKSIQPSQVPLVRRILGDAPSDARWELEWQRVAGEIDTTVHRAAIKYGKDSDQAGTAKDWRKDANATKREIDELRDRFSDELQDDPAAAEATLKEMRSLMRDFVIEYRKEPHNK